MQVRTLRTIVAGRPAITTARTSTLVEAARLMASCLATGVKQHVFTAQARRYDSALEAALSLPPTDAATAVAVTPQPLRFFRNRPGAGAPPGG